MNTKYISLAIALLAIASMIFTSPTLLQAYASTEDKKDLDIQEVGDDDNTAKMLKMAVKEGKDKSKKEPGFKLGPDNVLVIEPNKKVEITEDLPSGQSFDRAVVTDSKDKEIKVPITKQGVVDLKGFKEGVYTLDVIVKSGNKKIAYEVIIVIAKDKNDQKERDKGNKEAQRVSQDTTIIKKITIIEKTIAGPVPTAPRYRYLYSS